MLRIDAAVLSFLFDCAMYRAMPRLFRRILVPHDFSEHASAALRVAADLAGAHRGRITVVHALAPFYSGAAFPTQVEIAWVPSAELLSELRVRLAARVQKTLGSRARGVVCRTVMGDPATAIIDAARGCDSIVMATLGRTGLAHLVMGSVAEKVVRHSPVPVLTIRPTAARAGARGRRGRRTSTPARSARRPRARAARRR